MTDPHPDPLDELRSIANDQDAETRADLLRIAATLLDEREALLARIAALEDIIRHLVRAYGLEHPNGCKTCDQAAALVTPEADHD